MENNIEKVTERFVKKWQGKFVEEGFSYMTESAKSFARNFKSYLKTLASSFGGEIVNFSIGHYYFSGFIKSNDNYIYISRDIERYNQCINLNDKSPCGGILIRKAYNEKDYRGEENHFCNIHSLYLLMHYLLDIN